MVLIINTLGRSPYPTDIPLDQESPGSKPGRTTDNQPLTIYFVSGFLVIRNVWAKIWPLFDFLSEIFLEHKPRPKLISNFVQPCKGVKTTPIPLSHWWNRIQECLYCDSGIKKCKRRIELVCWPTGTATVNFDENLSIRQMVYNNTFMFL